MTTAAGTAAPQVKRAKWDVRAERVERVEWDMRDMRDAGCASRA
jgi:hypothetical protein